MKKILFFVLILLAAVLVYVSIPFDSSTKSRTESAEHDEHGHESDSRKRVTRPTGSGMEEPTASADIAQLKTILQTGNFEILEALLQKMAADLKNDPARLNELLLGLKTETDPRLLPMLTRIILEGGAITNKMVAVTALELAKQNAVEPQRHAGLYLLGEIPVVTPEMTDSVTQISREAGEVLVRTSALATMADWMKNNPQMKADLSGEILKTIQSTDFPEVRANGLLFIGHHLQDLPPSFRTEMVGFLQDPSHYNRAAAAQALAKLPQQSEYLPLIENALSKEWNIDARRLMLGAIVSASNTGSMPLLQQYANDPGLAQDVQDYIGILNGGTMDAREITMKKEEIDVRRNPAVLEKH